MYIEILQPKYTPGVLIGSPSMPAVNITFDSVRVVGPATGSLPPRARLTLMLDASYLEVDLELHLGHASATSGKGLHGPDYFRCENMHGVATGSEGRQQHQERSFRTK